MLSQDIAVCFGKQKKIKLVVMIHLWNMFYGTFRFVSWCRGFEDQRGLNGCCAAAGGAGMKAVATMNNNK